MTEEEAINDLTNMVIGEAPAEENKEPKAEENTETPSQEKGETPKEPDVKIDVAKIIHDQQKMVADQNKKIAELESKMQDSPTDGQSEEDMLIQEAQQKLGIDQQKMQDLYKMQEQMAQQEAFNNMLTDFKKNNEDIDVNEMGKWAEDNNLTSMLNSGDVNQWNVVANAMRAVAKVTAKPDNITPSNQKGAEQTVWQKVDKGEKVDDIDLGIDILKGVGGWE